MTRANASDREKETHEGAAWEGRVQLLVEHGPRVVAKGVELGRDAQRLGGSIAADVRFSSSAATSAVCSSMKALNSSFAIASS